MALIKILKLQILHGSIARRVLLRVILFASAMAIFSFLYIFSDIEPPPTMLVNVNSDGCASEDAFPVKFLKPVSAAYAFSYLSSSSNKCKENANVTIDMFRELMDKKLLNFDSNAKAKALCVGEEGSSTTSAVTALRELGFSNVVVRVNQHHPFFFLVRRRHFTDGLEFEDNSFDFVFSRAINRVSIPALFVIEIERILKPGGVGALLLTLLPNSNPPSPGSLIKTVTPVSAFLKNAEVIHVSTVVDSFLMVVFKKKFDRVVVNPPPPFEQFQQLPAECLSVNNNKPFIEHLEPLMEEEGKGNAGNFTYLPKLMDISSRKRFFYIDIGAGQFANSNITSWFFTSYPVKSRAFNVFVVDHDTSVLSSYVNKPGITFVYHPGLAGNNKANNNASVNHNDDDDDDLFPSPNDEGFDFLVWFRETVADGDFVVLQMNAFGVELKFLYELFESGAICLVDELFLRCPSNTTDGQDALKGDCLDLLKGLRSSGVFAHRWLEV